MNKFLNKLTILIQIYQFTFLVNCCVDFVNTKLYVTWSLLHGEYMYKVKFSINNSTITNPVHMYLTLNLPDSHVSEQFRKFFVALFTCSIYGWVSCWLDGQLDTPQLDPIEFYADMVREESFIS